MKLICFFFLLLLISSVNGQLVVTKDFCDKWCSCVLTLNLQLLCTEPCTTLVKACLVFVPTCKLPILG
ncbi:hypothetical protein Mgra_00009587 [Meloidogyne graminicola]|uniref:Uncharacterized protein n=1 Tax=Meloidogyne graminicola TaxID=189291 RepID=A0A8S9ZBT0_9BILA|nr:hypothetical protein Mgra_00009587 [Meloidogyne graminicola]